MNDEEHKIREEAAALWAHMYAEPPPQDVDGRTLLDLILQQLPDASYGRLHTPHLRPAAVVFPER